MGLLDLVSLARARQRVRWSLSVGTRFGIEEVAAGLLDKGLAPSEYPRGPNAESCRGGRRVSEARMGSCTAFHEGGQLGSVSVLSDSYQQGSREG